MIAEISNAAWVSLERKDGKWEQKNRVLECADQIGACATSFDMDSRFLRYKTKNLSLFKAVAIFHSIIDLLRGEAGPSGQFKSAVTIRGWASRDGHDVMDR